MSTNEERFLKRDRMRFTKNTLSSGLALLAILFNVFYFVSIYKSDVGSYYYNILTGASILYNLIFMLVVFLSSEGVKSYKASFAWVLLAVGALVFLLAPGRQISTPAVALPTLPPADSSAPVVPEHTAGAAMITVTPETVQTVIGTLRRIDSYSRTLDIRDFWSGGNRSRQIAVWRRGDRLRLRVSSGDSAQQELLFLNGEKWI